MTNFELAQTLVRFGAVRGMGLDGGGSSTLAFDGTVLNSPSDGRERAVSTALMLAVLRRLRAAARASGRLAERRRRGGDAAALVQGRPPVEGDGDADRARRHGRVPGARPARARELRRRLPARSRDPTQACRRRRPSRSPPAEGRWTLTVSATDDQGLSVDDDAAVRGQLDARARSASRRCGSLVRKPEGTRDDRLVAGAGRTRASVTVETPEGIVIRTVANATLPAGEQAVVWNGGGGNRQAGRRRPLRRPRDRDERARDSSTLSAADSPSAARRSRSG